MSPLQAIFFDAAGTLFHIKGSVAEVYLSYAERYGVKRTPESLAAVSAAFARAIQEAPPPVFAVTDPVRLKECERVWWFDVVHHVFYRVGMFEGFDDYFEEVFHAFDGPALWALYPETSSVLKDLKGQGFELGIISNFDTRLFTVLRGLGIVDLFDTVTIASLARAAKPSREIFKLALEKHAIAPAEALHVGDSLRDDVGGEREAGLSAVLLDREQHHATAAVPTIRTLEELYRVLAPP